MFGTVQMSCTYNCMCASPPPYIYIDISYIKCNVVTLSESKWESNVIIESENQKWEKSKNLKWESKVRKKVRI
jgi:hypothetical protein